MGHYQTKANRLLRAGAALADTLREAPAVVRDKDCAQACRAGNSTPPAQVGATFAGWDCSRTNLLPRWSTHHHLGRWLRNGAVRSIQLKAQIQF
jgi:hypothetical protein